MNVLILGCSSIATRRVLPALQGLDGVTAIDIASRRPLPDGLMDGPRLRQAYTDYAEALALSDADLVYVSLRNGDHQTWAEAALDAGKHVCVDKPAFADDNSAEALAAQAQSRGLCLAEATVIEDHPQVDLARRIMADNGGITRVTALFSIPPLPVGNFRYDPEQGGGVLYDMGPYAAACGRLFFGAAPTSLYARVLAHHPSTGIDTAFSILAAYPGGGALIGHFGFDTEYRNRVDLLGPGASVTIDRFFTTPPDLENPLAVSAGNDRSTVTAGAGDTFALFFDRLITAIGAGQWTPFSAALAQDAAFRRALRSATKETE